jgi:hypothetical protein
MAALRSRRGVIATARVAERLAIALLRRFIVQHFVKIGLVLVGQRGVVDCCATAGLTICSSISLSTSLK